MLIVMIGLLHDVVTKAASSRSANNKRNRFIVDCFWIDDMFNAEAHPQVLVILCNPGDKPKPLRILHISGEGFYAQDKTNSLS